VFLRLSEAEVDGKRECAQQRGASGPTDTWRGRVHKKTLADSLDRLYCSSRPAPSTCQTAPDLT